MAPRGLWARRMTPGGTQSSVGTGTRHIQSPHLLGHSGPAAPSSLPVIPDVSQFLCPQVKGVREGWERTEALPAPSLSVSQLPMSVLGIPGLELPGLCPAWRQGCQRSLTILRFAVGASSCLTPHVSTSHHCSDCQSQPVENLCGFGEGLLSLLHPGDTSCSSRSRPAPSLGMAQLALSWHPAFGCLALVLPRAPSAHIPHFGGLTPIPSPSPVPLFGVTPKPAVLGEFWCHFVPALVFKILNLKPSVFKILNLKASVFKILNLKRS